VPQVDKTLESVVQGLHSESESFFLPVFGSVIFWREQRAKSGQKKDGAGKKRAKKRWCGQKAGKKRINIHRSLLIYFAAIAPPLPSIKSCPTFAAIRRHLCQHLPLPKVIFFN